MIFADTGYFIAQLKPRDDLHSRAREWAFSLSRSNTRILTTQWVLLELGDALSTPRDRAKYHAALPLIWRDPRVEVVPASADWFLLGVSLHKARVDKEWSLTDCISFEIMRGRGVVSALAHDRHFEQAGFEPLLRREP